MLIDPDQINQFQADGYFVLEKVIPAASLAALRAECQRNLDLQLADMAATGADVLGLSHKEKRFFLPCRYEDSQSLADFIFSDLIVKIVQPLLGANAYLFLDLFIVKWPVTGSSFGWHQDSGYLLGNPHRPYVILWCALDDMTEDNGMLYVLPYSRAGTKEVVTHTKEAQTNDFIGYRGSDPGIGLPVPGGSIVVLSSTTFHRSGPNITDNPRSAYMLSYSPEPITDKNGKLYNLAVPLIRDGVKG